MSGPPGPLSPPKCQWCGDPRCGWHFVCPERQEAQRQRALQATQKAEDGLRAEGAAAERSHLRERVKALREKTQGLYDGSIATEMIMKHRGKLDAYNAVLALLAEPGEVDGEPRT